MTAPRARDESIGRWLESAGPDGRQAGEACLDAETAAAWLDGALTASALERAQLHVSDCGQCQALLATLINSQVSPAAEPGPAWAWNWRRWLVWAAPLTAAATALVALAVWVNVPVQPEPAPAAAVTAAAKPADQPPPPAPEPSGALKALRPETPAPAATAASSPSAPRAASPVERRALDAQSSKAATAEQANGLQAVAAPAWALADMVSAAIELVSPDPAIRWRISGAGVQRSSDRGATWVPVDTGVSAQFTAGAAPSSTVCWLVGRGGVVVLTTDGSRWTRAPFPEQADLSTVSARDALTATVVTTDGRSFTTSDAGRMWTLR